MATKIKGTAIGQRQYEDDGGEISYSFDGDGSEAFTEQPAVLVLTGERVYTESEVNAYVNDLFKAQFDPGAFTERYREEKVVGQPFEETVPQWIARAKGIVREKHGLSERPAPILSKSDPA